MHGISWFTIRQKMQSSIDGLLLKIQKRPLSIRIEGVKYAVPPLIRRFPHRNYPHGVQQRLSLFRATPSFPTAVFRKATPGGISARFPTALHQPAVLWRERERLLLPFTVLFHNPNKRTVFCQGFSFKNLWNLSKSSWNVSPS